MEIKYMIKKVREYKLPKKAKRRALVFLCVIVLIIAFWNQPVTRYYTIETEKLSKGSQIRIIQISDLHSTTYGKDQKRLIKRIDNAKPDIVVMTGDIVDDKRPSEGAYTLIEYLVEHYPVYYISGNHEHRIQKVGRTFKKLTSIGVNVLDSQSEIVNVDGEQIRISGVFDPDRNFNYSDEKEIEIALTETNIPDDELYNILLAHRPELNTVYQKFPVDLVLSGHAHGGQVRVPLLVNGIFSPGQGLLPKYAGGHYKFDTMDLIVSRGLSLYKILPRVFNPPEVVVIDLKGK